MALMQKMEEHAKKHETFEECVLPVWDCSVPHKAKLMFRLIEKYQSRI